MATEQQLMAALRKADAAGDERGARLIAERIKAQRAQKPKTRAEAKAQGVPRKEGGFFSQAGRSLMEGLGDVGSSLTSLNPLHTIASAIPDDVKMNVLKNEYSKYLPSPVRSALIPDKIVQNAAQNIATRQADRAGLAKPQDMTERVVQSGVRALPQVLMGGGGRGVGAKALEAGSNFMSGAAGQAAGEFGGGPIVQTIASILGGMSVPTAQTVAREVGNVGTHSKLALSGGKAAAAQHLQRVADNYGADALDALENRPDMIPGSKPTLGEITLDPGLAGVDISRRTGPVVSRRRANAAARQAAIVDTIGEGDPNAIQRIASDTETGLTGDLAESQRGAEAVRERVDRQKAAAREAAIASNQGEMDALRAAEAAEQARIAAEGQEAAARARRAGEGQVKARRTQGERAEQARREAIGKPVSLEESGRAAAEDISGEYMTYKDRSSNKYREIPNEPVKINANQRKQMFDEVNGKTDEFFAGDGADAPPEVQMRLKRLYDTLGDSQLTTGALVKLDKRLADFANDMYKSGDSTGREMAAFAHQMRDTITRHTERHTSRSFKKAWNEARAVRREQGTLFEEGRLGGLLERQGYKSGIGTPELELARKLVTHGDPGGELGRQLKAALKDRPGAAERIVREEFRRLADEGLIETRQQLRKYMPVLDQFPTVKRDIAKLRGQQAKTKISIAKQEEANAANISGVEAKTRQQLKEQALAAGEKRTETTRVQQRNARKEQLRIKWENRREVRRGTEAVKTKQQALNEFRSSPLGKTIAKGMDTDPVKVVSGMISEVDGREFKRLIRQAKESGDPNAIEGLRNAMGEHIKRTSVTEQTDKAGNFLPSTEGALKSVDDVLRNGAELLDDNQLNALKVVREELANSKYVKGAVPEGIEYKQAPAIPADTAVRRAIVKFVMAIAGNENRVDDLIEKAVLDRDFAKKLLQRPTYQRKRDIAKAFSTGAVGTAKSSARFVEQEQ